MNILRSFLSEFKKFAMRGNVIDMAVGVIIGAAFTKIVDSLVTDIVLPPIGVLLGEIDFSNMFVVLKDGVTPPPYASLTAAKAAGAITLNIGLFINAVISFLIVAFAVFVLIKAINELQHKLETKEEKEDNASSKTCPYCFTDIPIKATRCPNCTSELKEENSKGCTI